MDRQIGVVVVPRDREFRLDPKWIEAHQARCKERGRNLELRWFPSLPENGPSHFELWEVSS